MLGLFDGAFESLVSRLFASRRERIDADKYAHFGYSAHQYSPVRLIGGSLNCLEIKTMCDKD
jgi:hypothetical protein